MNRVKKLFTSVVSLMLIIGMLGTCCVFADTPTEIRDFENVQKFIMEHDAIIEGITFHISEYKCEDEGIIKLATRINEANKPLSVDGIKELLTMLGSDEDSLKAINEKSLEKKAYSSEFGSKIQYIKTNELTGNQLYLSESDALYMVGENLKDRETLKGTEFDRLFGTSQMTIDELNKNYDAWATRGNPFIDSYMRIQLYWDIEPGSDCYSFYTVARWLTMPLIRQTDAVGITATYIQYVPGSGYGHYYYTQTITTPYQTTNNIVYNTITNLYNPVNGNWFGGAGKYPVPLDAYDSINDIDLTCTNLTAYYECELKVMSPDSALNFNAAADHTHSKVIILPSVGISIAPSSIGISFTGVSVNFQDIRHALVGITYYP